MFLLPHSAFHPSVRAAKGSQKFSHMLTDTLTLPRAVVPSPETPGTGDWASAVAKARKFVDGLTLEELVNVTTGCASP